MSDVHIRDAADQSLDLTTALLIYRSSVGAVYVTAHEPLPHPDIAGTHCLGPGFPATKASLAEFAAAVSDATAFRGMIPPALIYTAPNLIAWWLPAQKRRVWFQSEDKRIGSVAAVVDHPPLIFVAGATEWYVYAFKENVRPDSGTRLFKAPYFNVWDSGRICTGNVDLPDRADHEVMSAYEDAFFDSRFTHPNDPHLVKYKGGATALWSDQLRDPAKPLIQPSVLVPRKETLAQAIQRIAKEN